MWFISPPTLYLPSGSCSVPHLSDKVEVGEGGLARGDMDERGTIFIPFLHIMSVIQCGVTCNASVLHSPLPLFKKPVRWNQFRDRGALGLEGTIAPFFPVCLLLSTEVPPPPTLSPPHRLHPADPSPVRLVLMEK